MSEISTDTFRRYFRDLNRYYSTSKFFADMSFCANVIKSSYKDGKWNIIDGCPYPPHKLRKQVFDILCSFSFYHNIKKRRWEYMSGTNQLNFTCRDHVPIIISCLYNNMNCLRDIGIDIDINAFRGMRFIGAKKAFEKKYKIEALCWLSRQIR